MIEKIKSGYYTAKVMKKRLCDVIVVVGGGMSNEPFSRETISYDEYDEIADFVIEL